VDTHATIEELLEAVFMFVSFEVHTALVMESPVLWDITPYSPLKVKRRVGETMSLPSSGMKSKPSKKPV
jgi:hypothetical protein